MKKTQSETCAVFLAIATGASALAGECAGDFSGDGIIDGADLSELLARWGSCPESCVHDLDGNGVIDGADLTVLLGYWGACP